MITAEWVHRVEVTRNNELHEQGINQHDFQWLHLGHDIKAKTTVVNSSVIDPTTGDPEPVFGSQLICLTCDSVRSAVE